MKLLTSILLTLLLSLHVSAQDWKFVVVDADSAMPWEDIQGDAEHWSSYPATNNVDMNENALTNASLVETDALQISGGSPAVGDVFVVTNANGTGELKSLPKIHAENNTAYVIDDAWFELTFPTTAHQQGGTWDGTNWTPGVVGWVQINVYGAAKTKQLYSTSLFCNESRLDIIENDNVLRWRHSFADYNDNATNRYSFHLNAGGTISTNDTGYSTYFNGAVLP